MPVSVTYTPISPAASLAVTQNDDAVAASVTCALTPCNAPSTASRRRRPPRIARAGLEHRERPAGRRRTSARPTTTPTVRCRQHDPVPRARPRCRPSRARPHRARRVPPTPRDRTARFALDAERPPVREETRAPIRATSPARARTRSPLRADTNVRPDAAAVRTRGRSSSAPISSRGSTRTCRREQRRTTRSCRARTSPIGRANGSARCSTTGGSCPGWPPELGGRNATPTQQMIYFEEIEPARRSRAAGTRRGSASSPRRSRTTARPSSRSSSCCRRCGPRSRGASA